MRYEHRRKGQNDAMMHSMSAIGWLESRAISIDLGPELGLKQVEQISFLKERFMQQANGLGLYKTPSIVVKIITKFMLY
jgi:hypothetical protein